MRLGLLCGFLFAWVSAFDAKAEFRVGILLPMTGPSAEYGVAMHNSIRLAVEDAPENFTSIRLILEDSRNDAKTAVAGFQKLSQMDHIDLLYLWGVAPCAAVLPIAESQQVPTIAQCYDATASLRRQFVIRFMNKTQDYMTVLSRELSRRGLKRSGVILSETPFIEEMYEGFQKTLAPENRIDLLGRYHLNEMDLRITVSKMRTGAYDSLGVFLALGQVAQFFRQAREQNLSLPSFGTISFESAQEARTAGGAMEGAFFAGNEVSPEFLTRYRSRFGEDSQNSFAAMAYEFVRLLGDLLASHSELSGKEAFQLFQKSEPRVGKAVPSLRFVDSVSEGKHFEFPLIIKTVERLQPEKK